MNTTQTHKVAHAVARAEQFCSREKAIQLVAMNSRYSISEVREAAKS